MAEDPGGRIRFSDDTLTDFALVKYPGFADGEYQIKDMTTRVFWREQEGAYFTSADGSNRFDVKAFLEHRSFGAWLEAYSAATEFAEQAKGHDDRRAERIALDMHVLQQFFTNALFSPTEIKRFDYQSSPLNFQDEHTYIRALATGIADVLRERLTDMWGPTWTDRVFLGNDDVLLRSAVRQSFPTLDISAEDLRDPSRLRARIGPMSNAIVEHLFRRSQVKKEIEEKHGRDSESVRASLTQATLELKRLPPPALPADATEDERRLDQVLQTEKVIADTLAEMAREDATTKQFTDRIGKFKENIGTAEKEASGGQPSQKLTGLRASLAATQSKLNDHRTAIRQRRTTLEDAAKSLGLNPHHLVGREADRREELLAANRLSIIERLPTAGTSAFIQAVVARTRAQRTVRTLSQQQAALRAPQPAFQFLRNFPGGTAFVDLTEVFRTMPANDIQQFFGSNSDSDAGRTIAEALRESVLSGAIEQYVTQNFGTLGVEARTKLITEIKDFVSKRVADLPTLTEMAGSQQVPVADLLRPLTGLIDEITPGATGTSGLDKLLVVGGVLTLDADEKGYRQPALLISDKTLKEVIKSIIGKSGLVPSPTDAARKLLTHDVPLPDIVGRIIEIQHDRDKNSAATRDKLTAIRALVSQIAHGRMHDIGGARSTLEATRKSFEEFRQLAEKESDHVRLLGAPVARMIDCLGILDDRASRERSRFSPFALAQLHQNLDAAIANQRDIVQFTRTMQNLHELIIHALELGARPGTASKGIPVPPGAQQVQLTHYGLAALTQTYNAVLAQHRHGRTDQDGPALSVTAFNDIYFEMMQRITRINERAPENVVGFTNINDFLARYVRPGATATARAPDFIVIDIHPNDAAKITVHRHDVIRLVADLFAQASPDYRCTIMVDITLNHVADDEVAAIREAAEKHISSGQLNLVFMQSLTKFAQLGSDKHSGGLLFSYNNPDKWAEFNKQLAESAKRNRVDPTIASYFDLLFQVTRKEQEDYINKVRWNTRHVYHRLKEAFAGIGVGQSVLELADNDDPRTCYVAFHYQKFAAAVYRGDTSGKMLKEMAHAILYDTIDKVADKLSLPLNMRTSFGFPISNLGDIDPGIRLTVGIEDVGLLNRYIQLLTFVNGRISTEMSTQGSQRLAEPATRKAFLAEIVAEINTLDDLDKRFAEQIRDQKTAPNWQPVLPVSEGGDASLASGQTDPVPADDPTVGIGRIEHIYNSCYAATILNLFAATPAYLGLLKERSAAMSGPGASDIGLPKAEKQAPARPEQSDRPSAVPVVGPGEKGRRTTAPMLASTLAALVASLRKPDGIVTRDQVAALLEMFVDLEAVSPPFKGQAVSVHDQQDAAEVLERLLSVLMAGNDFRIETERVKTPVSGPTSAEPQPSEPILHLGLLKPTSIADAIRQYCAQHEVGTSGETSRLRFRGLPVVLTVSVKRHHLQHGAVLNLDEAMELPDEFIFPGDCLTDPTKSGKYRLTAFAHHRGETTRAGHYIAYVRAGDKWIRNDDISGRSLPGSADMKAARSTGYLYTYQLVG